VSEVESLNESLAGINTLLMGPAGTGKTHSIGTLVDTGIEVFYIALENGLESLLGYYTDRGLPIPPNLHWHTVKAPAASFTELIDSASKINILSLDAVSKMQDPNRGKHNQFISLLTALNNFPDDRTGQQFGAVDTWGTDRALVIDGMAGVNRCAMSLVIGGKPVKNQADWGIAQTIIENFLRKCTDDSRCHFVLLAHVERETDAVLGGVKLMISTLGKALAPKIPSMFSDVILTVRNGDKWTWDTNSAMADVKTRNLPMSATNPPDFGAIIEKWRSRGGQG
jgi:hypothetical protein